MRRLAALAVALLACSGAAPAWAHQEITPASVTVGRPIFFTLSASNEKRVDVTSVTMTPSSGQQFGHATRDPAGWNATLTHTRITWSGGAIRPDHFEQFGFDIEPVGQPGTLAFRVSLGYADGTTSESEVQVSAVVAADTPPAPATTATAPATTVAAESGSTIPGTSAPAPAAEADDEDSGSGSGVATLALIVALVALAVSIMAAVRNRRPGGAPGSPTTSAAEGGQDW